MFAVAKIQGNQYTLSEGQTLKTQKVPVSQGQKFTVKDVLLISDTHGIRVGTPYLDGYEIEFEVLDHAKGDKIRVFKMKAKKRYMRTHGHRQWYSTLKVVSIYEAGKKKEEISRDSSISVSSETEQMSLGMEMESIKPKPRVARKSHVKDDDSKNQENLVSKPKVIRKPRAKKEEN
ncbi:50S ribosomal protein L21 [Candidatus Peregrinibacteria bacterium]|nr:50S ribosomal protein L21 [Candidatus Peregrinibacteria bacterium]